jgi:hypothetical protein
MERTIADAVADIVVPFLMKPAGQSPAAKPAFH